MERQNVPRMRSAETVSAQSQRDHAFGPVTELFSEELPIYALLLN